MTNDATQADMFRDEIAQLEHIISEQTKEIVGLKAQLREQCRVDLIGELIPRSASTSFTRYNRKPVHHHES